MRVLHEYRPYGGYAVENPSKIYFAPVRERGVSAALYAGGYGDRGEVCGADRAHCDRRFQCDREHFDGDRTRGECGLCGVGVSLFRCERQQKGKIRRVYRAHRFFRAQRRTARCRGALLPRYTVRAQHSFLGDDGERYISEYLLFRAAFPHFVQPGNGYFFCLGRQQNSLHFPRDLFRNEHRRNSEVKDIFAAHQVLR